jgi:DNA-binding PadR family transcriptional regulator
LAQTTDKRRRQVKILFVLAKDGPLNAYKTWHRLEKENVGTQPTIRANLEEMCESGLVEIAETDSKARGGDPSPYYRLRLRGLAAIIAYYDLLGDKAESPNQLVSKFQSQFHWISGTDLEYHGLIEIIDIWPEFIREKVDALAWERLRATCQLADPLGAETASRNDVTSHFVEGIADALVVFSNPKRAKWMQVIATNQKIRHFLIERTLFDLRDRMSHAIMIVEALPSDYSIMSEEPSLYDIFRGRMDVLLDRMTIAGGQPEA